jgi:hypothetical protein
MENNNDNGIVQDERGQDQPKDKQRAQQSAKTPAAGPHAKPELTDNSKTPGTGTPNRERSTIARAASLAFHEVRGMPE